jgi:hypothetical protein
MVEETQPEAQPQIKAIPAGNQKELVEYIARAIVNAPNDVKVTEEAGEGGTVLKLEVAADDKGRIIGKQGRVAEAMRTLIRVNAAKTGTKIRLEIV